MEVKIKLLSDAIFGSGKSIPGGEDISVLHDAYGFPYISGSSVKGVLREEIENYFAWTNVENPKERAEELFGCAGDKMDMNQMNKSEGNKISVSDFTLPVFLRKAVIEEMGIYDKKKRQQCQDFVLDIFTGIRTFTSIEDGMIKEHSLRAARFVKSELIFEGEILCAKDDEGLVEDCLKYVKWLGTMRTRGFGNVHVMMKGE